eukprot:GCRY01000785.1.p1 GENE.GCRY01000785.1~~GCRY01000785.1.p1  ORF type:complete len:323 (+),score=62.58 GCRY01000785.1:143-1111(+)
MVLLNRHSVSFFLLFFLAVRSPAFPHQEVVSGHLLNEISTINVPRIVGSKNHSLIAEHLFTQCSSSGGIPDIRSFSSETPIGFVTFSNVLCSFNPKSKTQYVFAAHYDSKMLPSPFLGSTDSAVPTALLSSLLNTTLSAPALSKQMRKKGVGVKVVFFDGEEAFEEWSPEDSIYGARQLAYEWSLPQKKGKKSELSRIKLFVLLDILGQADTRVHLLNAKTEKYYQKCRRLETRLRNRLPNDKAMHSPQAIFTSQQFLNAYVEDDHTPFEQRGVPILHLISLPFHQCWHQPCDNWDVLDGRVIRDLELILAQFVADLVKSPS